MENDKIILQVHLFSCQPILLLVSEEKKKNVSRRISDFLVELGGGSSQKYIRRKSRSGVNLEKYFPRQSLGEILKKRRDVVLCSLFYDELAGDGAAGGGDLHDVEASGNRREGNPYGGLSAGLAKHRFARSVAQDDLVHRAVGRDVDERFGRIGRDVHLWQLGSRGG